MKLNNNNQSPLFEVAQLGAFGLDYLLAETRKPAPQTWTASLRWLSRSAITRSRFGPPVTDRCQNHDLQIPLITLLAAQAIPLIENT